MTRELRPYQRECLERIRARYHAGKRRVLVSLPTGTGKTVVFSRFPRYFGMKKRLLVLAHRGELLEQALDKFRAADPELRVEVEQAARRASADCKVVVASVATLGRASTSRLGALDPEEFYLVVVDEAHHAVSPTYRRIFDHLGLMAPGTRKLLVGFTATPRRGDRRGLGEVFEEVAYSRRLEEMIGEGYLARVRGWRVQSGVSLDGVRVRAGDFVESQLADAVDVGERNALLVAAYRELAPGRHTLVFCVNVAHAQSVARTFGEAGVRAEAVWGAMAPDARGDALARFARGELDVLTNCNVLTEGYDEPRVDCVMMARPTHSQLLYAQMVGRGTRLHQEKTDLLVIDVVDNSAKHSLAGLHSLFDLPLGLDLGGADALQVAQDLHAVARRYPWVAVDRLKSPDDLRVVAERIDLFRFEPPDEIAMVTSFAWCRTPAGSYRLALPRAEHLEVSGDLLDSWQITYTSPASGVRPIGRADSLEQAVQRADAHVRRHLPDVVDIVDIEGAWRERKPSDRQLAFLRSRKIPVPEGLTRGQASWMISLLSTSRSGP
jgi:superfamily II DNA or RNA helicase